MAEANSRRLIVEVIREEIGKYAERPFTDDEDLIRDVQLVGDDVTAAMLTIEKRLSVRVERPRYLQVHSVDELADAIQETLAKYAT